jgi:hypothetical protein
MNLFFPRVTAGFGWEERRKVLCSYIHLQRLWALMKNSSEYFHITNTGADYREREEVEGMFRCNSSGHADAQATYSPSRHILLFSYVSCMFIYICIARFQYPDITASPRGPTTQTAQIRMHATMLYSPIVDHHEDTRLQRNATVSITHHKLIMNNFFCVHKS